MVQVLPDSWERWLGAEFQAPYMQQLKAFLAAEKAARKTIYPHSSDWFRAFELTPLDEVRVVILGQDPYHGPGQAHGLCFSVREGIKPPPSLVNIYKELAQDLGVTPVNHGHLEAWARQGVLLLNTSLTVEEGNAGSHRGKGWETFTDRAIETVNAEAPPCVFLLWGSHARQKKALVDQERHLVLESPHPSPLSAHRGFFGNHHFSRANAFLAEHGRSTVDWQLPPTP
ncbi:MULTISPECIES: uracil-DNA glycosylase [unclassified Halomonas]|uniref:uracil-DNA glycosylase n=1 Tax=unclassified Halomonas TaxID=2609666 RepID=UPI000C91A030|nr:MULTISPECIES: uracil-DNA glycosylase [unclassified Halomonas]MBR9772268.1 uracil-DNA glycosylase [Gammaproteobacteria bacterium]MBS8267239.1 uracil-DNA glycosylase [Halomonas litopenaei]MAR74325.1 uracil-DNA glycosylase [Halomonas sp.]MBR9881591.1 uracil-DNA glycosylase [Gammaproteobacteria bacterium]MCJ8287535.1 uracil-DNA glycosylase [Halomonas sp.]|tara:strand:+ start:1057 stop:1740 length:684 start_codon:yes stop_codon:yes gene_type:complete